MSVQLKLSVSEKLLERLEKARQRFGKRTPQAVAGEVVEDYLYLWEAAEERRQRFVEKQNRRELKKIVGEPEPDEQADQEHPQAAPQES